MKRQTTDIPKAADIYRATRQEYAYQGGIFATDEPKVAAVKWILENKLDDAERIIIHLYCEMQSMARVAHLLGIGRSTAAKEILRIKKKVLTEYDTLENDMLGGSDGVRC